MCCRKLARCVLIGHGRNAVQDLEFSIHHMVEIALRALSPGINDPFTAMAVIDRLALTVGHVMARGPAKNTWEDDKGIVRLKAPVSTFEGITDASFHQIRQRAASSADVLIRMVEQLAQLIEIAGPRHRAAFDKHLQLVVNTARRTIAEKADIQALEARAAAGLKQDAK